MGNGTQKIGRLEDKRVSHYQSGKLKVESLKRLKSEKLRVKNLHNQLWKNLFNIDFDLKGNKAIREYVNKFISKAILVKYYLNCFIKELISLFTYSPIHFKKAFTLAEVLITLGIIGVVAALTMPTLIQKIEEQRTVAQLSKVYSTLSQSWQRMEQEYGTIDTWGLAKTNTGKKDKNNQPIYDYSAPVLVAQRLSKFLKVTKFCEPEKPCDSRNIYALNGQLIRQGGSINHERMYFYLNDGTFITVGWYNDNTKTIDLGVTLPGKTAIYGKTTFYFIALPYKIVPEGTAGTIGFDACRDDLTNTRSGRGCTAWVIYNKNMDYLHCPDELSWNGKTKCTE